MENAESRSKNRLEVFSWVFYDFANTIFSMNVVSLYFPLWITVNHGWEDIWVSCRGPVRVEEYVADSKTIMRPILFADRVKQTTPPLNPYLD